MIKMWLSLFCFYFGGCVAVSSVWLYDWVESENINKLIGIFLWPVVYFFVIVRSIRGN